MSKMEDDFRLMDGYTAFSGEIARVALLSPTVFLFLVALAGQSNTMEELRVIVKPVQILLAFSFLCFALAVLLALLHRYFAVEFMREILDARRKQQSADIASVGRKATWSLVLAPTFLALGSALLFCALFIILRS